MITEVEVMDEDVRRGDDGTEYVSVTCFERGPAPLLQTFDYNLNAEERHLKGTLKGKKLKIHWKTIRGVFNGRAQVLGSILGNGEKA